MPHYIESLPKAIDKLIATQPNEALILASDVFRLFAKYVTKYNNLSDYPVEMRKFCQTNSAMSLLLSILGLNMKDLIEENDLNMAIFLTKLERELKNKINSLS